ncbi:MAG TPA: ABC transporter permease [Alloacidobacterium sp.]|nr:ABC transporter permease [Alloacidobacterium sp.]
MSLWSRVVNVFRGDRLNREIEEEFETHIAEAVEQGRNPEEALRAFGAATQRRQESHDALVVGWLDSLRADLVFGWRQLKRNKVTSFAAILSLALAIGACTSAFRLIDALLLRPLPVAHPERLYVLSRQGIGFDDKPGSFDSWMYPCFQLMRAAAKGDAELIAVSYADRADVTYKTDQEMEKANLQHVSGWMFPTFGIEPALGRLFTENDDLKPGAAPYAVLSYDYWSRRFGRDPNVIGHTFHFGDGVYQIVGVSEKKFTGTEPGTIVDIFIPTMMHRGVTRSDWTWFRTIVVMKPGVAGEPLRAKLAAITHAFEENRLRGESGLSPETLKNVLANQVLMEPAPTGVSGMQQDYNRALGALGVLVLMVLLIACANVANLMTAQAAARAREMALRVSIGAGRWRLVQMVLVESALLALLAAASGALFAWWSAPFVVSMINPPDNPARLILPADWRVLGFGIALTLIVVLLFGLLPALRASSVKPVSILKGGDDPHSRQRLMHAMIALQVAFCFLVLFVAGLFVATFQRLSNKPTGFSTERLLLLETTSRPKQSSLYWDQVADHLRAMPGVERVSQASWALLKGVGWNDSISVNGGPPSTDLAYFMNVSPGFLETMRIPLVSGRDLRESDTYPNAVIVNETFARKFLNDVNVVGRSVEKASDDGSRERMQIVGVMRDADYRGVREPMLPVVFVPFHHMGATGEMRTVSEETFIVRTASANPLALAATLRQEVSKVHSEFHVSNVRTQLELNQAQTTRERLLATLAFFFGAVALLLAGVGLYGVLNYSVQQREREIGIRMALGVQVDDVARRVMAGITVAVAIGAVAGLALGLASVRYIESLLYQVKATDAGVLAIPCLTILLAVVIAALPAVLRAMRIDPVAMLRVE